MIAQLRDDDEAGDMADVLALANKMSSLPTRTKTMKELGETLKNLILLERQAYSIDSQPEGSSPTPGSVVIPIDPIEAARIYQEMISGG